MTFYAVPHNGTETSKEAADSIKNTVNRLCKIVLAEIKAAPAGLTCQEVEDALQMSSGTTTARINELANSQPPMIVKRRNEFGRFIKRDNRSGRKAFVWFSACDLS
jgi:hypothetical protein